MDIDAILAGEHCADLVAEDLAAWRTLCEHIAWKKSAAAPARLILGLLREEPGVVVWIERFEKGARIANYDRKMPLAWFRAGLTGQGVPPYAAIEGELYDAAFGPRPAAVTKALRDAEALTIAQRMVDACPNRDADHARALLYVAHFASDTGDLEEAEDSSHLAALIYRVLRDPRGEARARRAMAKCRILDDRLEEACHLLEPDLHGSTMTRPFRSFPVLPGMVADRTRATQYLAACVTSEGFAFGPDWVFALGALSVHAIAGDEAPARFKRELHRLLELAGNDRPLAAAEVVRQARNAKLPEIESMVRDYLTPSPTGHERS